MNDATPTTQTHGMLGGNGIHALFLGRVQAFF
jgi:hypothetical protein